MTIEQIYKSKDGQPALFLVKIGETIIGQLEKYNDTRSETHPWKAFAGTGETRKFLGSFYPEEGGKAFAIRAIVKAGG